MQLGPTATRSQNPLARLSGIDLARVDRRLWLDSRLRSTDEMMGRIDGYASIGNAIAAARILTRGTKPAAVVIEHADRYYLAGVKAWDARNPVALPYRVGNADLHVRFDRPEVNALVDGASVARAGAVGTYVQISR